MTAHRVTGLDLSLTSTGIAHFYGKTLDLETIKSSGKRDATWGQRGFRLQIMAHEIIESVDMYGPDLVVIETPSYGSNMAGKHDVSGLWWMVTAPLLLDYRCAFVAPLARAKYGTGNGRSPKDVVEAFVHQTYTELIIREGGRFKNDDECDATLLAAMGMRWLGTPVEPHDLYETNLQAMEKVAWPLREDVTS
jgi:Holliday junction resolvasome RuvABC endonuclease subunit